MILFNGERALRGIFWKNQSDTAAVSHAPVDTLLIDKSNHPLVFGVYDPSGTFDSLDHFKVQQVYVSWVDIQNDLLNGMKEISMHGATPLVTVEPWPKASREESLMQDIIEGMYDPDIERLAAIFNEAGAEIYLSWGHEMDQDLTKRYPWSGVEPEDYINAFRYVADKLNASVTPEIKWIWNPVVKKGCERYWPGDDYINFIGLPVYSFPQWDNRVYGYTRSFEETFREKYNMVAAYSKPVWITEFGVTGSSDFQAFWLHQAFNEFSNFPLLHGVIFFHAEDVAGAWGGNLPTPNWKTDPATITGLVQWHINTCNSTD